MEVCLWCLLAGRGGVDEHALLSDLFEVATLYDQPNVWELCHMEMVARRYQMWEEFYRGRLVSREGRGRASSGLASDERSIFLGQKQDRSRGLVCPLLGNHVANELKDRSSVFKERRKARAELIMQEGSQSSAAPGGGGR